MYRQGDTWFDEIRLPIRNSQYEYNVNSQSTQTDDTYVECDMSINSYVEMQTYNKTKALQERDTYGKFYKKVERCRECCTMDNCIPCFVCGLLLLFVLTVIIIYNVTDFDTAIKSCKKQLDKPVEAIVIYRNISLDDIASFEYPFDYNKYYTFNITCNITVGKSPKYPVGTVKKLYISKTRNECSFNDHWCESQHIGPVAAFMLSVLGACIICPLTLPCFICIIKSCNNNT